MKPAKRVIRLFQGDELIYLGPRCSYHPERPTTPTGLTWRELAAQREQRLRETLRLQGIDNPDPSQLCAHPMLSENDTIDLLRQLMRKKKPSKK